MWLVGVVVRRYIYRFPHSTYPYSSICSFLQQHPYFLFIFRRKKNAKSLFFYFARCVRKLRYYSDVIHSFDWKSAIKHDGCD